MYKKKLFSSFKKKSNLDRVQQLLSNFISDLNLLYALEKKHFKILFWLMKQKLWNNESNTATGLRVFQFVFDKWLN